MTKKPIPKNFPEKKLEDVLAIPTHKEEKDFYEAWAKFQDRTGFFLMADWEKQESKPQRIKYVPIEKIRATETLVNPHHVARKTAVMDMRKPRLAFYKHLYYVIDGKHRIIAKGKRKEKHVLAQVIDITNPSQKDKYKA